MMIDLVPDSGTRHPLARLTLGINQILWTNDDLPDLTPPIDWLLVLDEMHRLGYAGTQLGRDFARGDGLRRELATRHLRIAEVYAALDCGPDGPSRAGRRMGSDKVSELESADGHMLVVALAPTAARIPCAGRAQDRATPRISRRGIRDLAGLLEDLAHEAAAVGRRLAFHPHAGTYVETPEEIDRLMSMADPALVGLCLDVGHSLIGGGDPVATIRRYGDRVRHVHLKDVDELVLRRMRDGRCGGFLDGLRERIFTELGAGVLDLAGVLTALALIDYRGWIMVEQDTTWRPPSESAAISIAVLRFALRHLAAGPTGVRS